MVLVDHPADAIADMIIEELMVIQEDGQQLLAERPSSGHPLHAVPANLKVRTVELRSRDHPLDPFQQLLMPYMHMQDHVRVEPVSSKVTLAREDTHEEPFLECIHRCSTQLEFTTAFSLRLRGDWRDPWQCAP
jgi:hypothetical protein